MREALGSPTTARNHCIRKSGNGESILCTAAFGCVSAVIGLPSRHRPPLDRNLQLERRLFLLLPLGQGPIPPAIILRRYRCRR
ncbi:unnamed protein product [Cuscuta europaea]|uniref:Uncharacterized protein n=1 Tax=Cuscuta europaea TaxID=41803 RepID=A0A9P0ZNC3_CUSEU|nr:unnamed protein product [Cuscuta europaea]